MKYGDLLKDKLYPFLNIKLVNKKYGTLGFALLLIVPVFIIIILIFSFSSDSQIAVFKSHEEKIFAHYQEHIFGIDISHYQGRVEWEKVKQFKNGEKISFIIMRAAIGEDEEDQEFTTNWINVKKLGIIRGAYHYYRPDENSIKQADNFISIVNLEKGDFPPVLDIEALPNYQSIKSLKIGLIKWLNKIENHYGIRPVIYTGDSYYHDFLNDTIFQKYVFWIANFNRVKKPKHKNWKIWQFSETGQIDGINHDIDFNVFQGDIMALRKMILK
ncbi:MAG: glycoside hydrolase family 25 protein [Bacteroidetes bacterium]|nr:MAG: glycoside hydrolase family 25 protein [Bacteroidota bacterium]